MKARFAQFYCSQDMNNYSSLTNEVADDKTNMAEIVKRFSLGQEIPQTLEEKQYEYSDIEKQDETGNMITEEVLTDEILNLIPITPNLDYMDRLDADSVEEMYNSATEKARGFVRAKREEQKALKNLETAESIDKLQKLGFTVSEQKTAVSAPENTNTVVGV